MGCSHRAVSVLILCLCILECVAEREVDKKMALHVTVSDIGANSQAAIAPNDNIVVAMDVADDSAEECQGKVMQNKQGSALLEKDNVGHHGADLNHEDEADGAAVDDADAAEEADSKRWKEDHTTVEFGCKYTPLDSDKEGFRRKGYTSQRISISSQSGAEAGTLGVETMSTPSAIYCKRRCTDVAGCAHFTFWEPTLLRGGGCHLQGPTATKKCDESHSSKYMTGEPFSKIQKTRQCVCTFTFVRWRTREKQGSTREQPSIERYLQGSSRYLNCHIRSSQARWEDEATCDSETYGSKAKEFVYSHTGEPGWKLTDIVSGDTVKTTILDRPQHQVVTGDVQQITCDCGDKMYDPPYFTRWIHTPGTVLPIKLAMPVWNMRSQSGELFDMDFNFREYMKQR